MLLGLSLLLPSRLPLVLGLPRETGPTACTHTPYIHMYGERETDLLIGSHDQEVWETSYSLSSVNHLRPRKSSSQFPSESKGLKTMTANSLSPSVRAGEGWCLVQAGRCREDSPFLCLFVLFRSSTYWKMPIDTGEGIDFAQSMDSHANIFLNTLTDTPRNV